MKRVFNLKHYHPEIQAIAIRWWRTLSINEMKALERKYEIVRLASHSDIAFIYEAEHQLTK